MKRLFVFVASLLLLGLQGDSQVSVLSTSGTPAPTLSGTGAPSGNYTCNTNLANIMYIQTDAASGQRIWLCDNATGSLAWDHFSPPQQIGTTVASTGVTGALAAQTICDTSATCPAGWYELYVYIRPTATGTLAASTTAQITYTDMIGTVTNYTLPSTCSGLNLLTVSPGSCDFFFYHAANTAVTLNTTFANLGGSPVYSVYARNTYLGT